MLHLRVSIVGVALGLLLHAAAVAQVKWPECKCQNYGRYMLVGEVGCIRTNKGPRMARCILKGNVTYWEFLDEPCPVA